MRRLLLLLAHELKLARASIPIHLVAVAEPLAMYALLTVILVHPTMDVHVERPRTPAGRALVDSMREVGSPIGLPYISPVLVDDAEPHDVRQVISVEERDGVATAVQRFNLIDSNLVKNYRNRLTASALRLWDAALAGRAVVVEERPTLERDVPYNAYFGVAMLPLAVFLAAAMVGGVLTAQEFEHRTFSEQRLAPTSPAWTLVARLVRLVLTALVAASLLLPAIGAATGVWPDSIVAVLAVMLPLAVVAGCLGILAGLVFRATLPVFLSTLVSSFVGWTVGQAFKPAVAVGGVYEWVARLSPNTYAVDVLFPRFFGSTIGRASPSSGLIVLTVAAAALVVLTVRAFGRRARVEE